MTPNPISISFIEESGRWRRIAVSLFAHAIQAESLHPDSWTVESPIRDWVAIEYSPLCLEKWFSLFDKTPMSLENRNWTLLNPPPDLNTRSRLLELGFTGFVSDPAQLKQILQTWISISQHSISRQDLTKPQQSQPTLRDKLSQMLPTRLTRNRKQEI